MRAPRVSAALSATAATLLLTSGCAPVEPVDTAEELPPVEVDESLGVVRLAEGSDIPLRIVLDGDADPEGLGPALEAAVAAAVEDFGVIQQRFRVDLGTPLTTTCDTGDGARAADAVLEDPTVVGVIGPQCMATLRGLQPSLTAAGLVIVTPRPTDVTLTVGADGTIGQDRAEGTWRTSPSLLREGVAAADHAVTGLELTRAAVLHDGSIGAVGLADAFRARFEALGGTVVVEEQVDPGVTDADDEVAGPLIDALLDSVAAGDVDVAFLPLGPDALLAVAPDWNARSGLSGVTRIATGLATTPEVLAAEAATGHLLTGPALDPGDAVSAVTGMSASQTLERVVSLSGVEDPVGWWAMAYDAATLLLKAIEDTSLVDTDGSLVISRAELRATMARTTFGGLTGRIACTATGDCGAGRILIRALEEPPADGVAGLPVVAEYAG